MFANDAYAHYGVNALIRHAPHALFQRLIQENILPAVHTLISHKFAITVLHSVYSSKWCSAHQRQLLIMAIYKDNMTVMSTWTNFPDLYEVIRANQSIQKRLLTQLFDLCDKLVSQKDAIGFPFVQRLLYIYLRCGVQAEMAELCDTIRPHLPNLILLSVEGALLTSVVFALS
uniref:Uncharacterized protein n=1 Tax=Lygus hesperus TaxID=30085 RepID=A0A146LJ94_LYGHE